MEESRPLTQSDPAGQTPANLDVLNRHYPGVPWTPVSRKGRPALSGFVEVRGGGVGRVLIVDGELRSLDENAVVDALLVHEGQELDPTVVFELLGTAGLLPRRFWTRPTRQLDRLAARLVDEDETLRCAWTDDGLELIAPLSVYDGGGLAGRVVGVGGPGRATRYRLVALVHEDGVETKEEVWHALSEGGCYKALVIGDEAVPARSAEPRTMNPYTSAQEHLADWLERVRLLTACYIRRNWPRLTDSTGHIDDTFISVVEAVNSIDDDQTFDSEVGLPPLDELEEDLADVVQTLTTRTGDTESAGAHEEPLPIVELARELDLDDDAIALLVLAAAPQLSVAMSRLLRFAVADHQLRQPPVGVLAEIVGGSESGARQVMRYIHPAHPLMRLELVELRPAPGWHAKAAPALQVASVPGRVASYLVGEPDGLRLPVAIEHDDLGSFCRLWSARPPSEHGNTITRALRRAAETRVYPTGYLRPSDARPLVALVGPSPAAHRDAARSAALGTELLTIDLRREDEPRYARRTDELSDRLVIGLREAVLLGATPMVVLGDRLANVDPEVVARMARHLTSHTGPALISVARLGAELRHQLGPCPEVEINLPKPQERETYWRDVLSDELEGNLVLDEGLTDIAHQYAMSRSDIVETGQRACLARDLARPGQALLLPELQTAVRQQIEHHLDLLAEPFSTPLTWDDLILPQDLKDRLREMVSYASNEKKVHETWGFGRINTYGRGLTALFAGPPGTGKTLAAAIMAKQLGRQLFRVDLSRVVDKYVGETEKNLARVFDEAERGRAVLLFDEADSLFGKRTSVSSANDRYANLEVNFLLQRMEHFDGTSILTTNYADGLDEAFQRRIKFRLSFRLPDPAEREQLWQLMLPDRAPVTEEIAFDKLAGEFEMAPAHIKNAVLRAAFAAAERDCAIDYAILRESAVIEYRELGNLVRE